MQVGTTPTTTLPRRCPSTPRKPPTKPQGMAGRGSPAPVRHHGRICKMGFGSTAGSLVAGSAVGRGAHDSSAACGDEIRATAVRRRGSSQDGRHGLAVSPFPFPLGLVRLGPPRPGSWPNPRGSPHPGLERTPAQQKTWIRLSPAWAVARSTPAFSRHPCPGMTPGLYWGGRNPVAGRAHGKGQRGSARGPSGGGDMMH